MKNDRRNLKYRGYGFSIAVIRFISRLPNGRSYWVVGDQLLRAATSVGANIIEAKSASSRKDFIKYYQIALKSANETKYWLCLIRDAMELRSSELGKLLGEADELSKMLGSSILTLKGKKF